MGTFPGYQEYDVSLWFLFSLGLFFAMLIGDGGYGLLFLAGTFALSRKARDLPPGVTTLLYLFSGGTVIWGTITGTWFGVEGLANAPVLNRLIVPALHAYTDNQDFMFRLCFIIGTIHLIIAHLIRLARHIKSRRALAEIGWILTVVFLYFLAGNLVLNQPLPAFAVYLLPPGIFHTSSFSTPGGNFFKSFALTLADLPLNVIRAFSDVVSYIRLFAVGYATLIVAVSFNQMAAEFGWGSVPRGIAASLVLLVGHTLNIILAGMAVLVHGIRLNMLEFSSHLEMSWSGRKFTPFRRRTEARDTGENGL
jgi:V/A-type H+-transporting ATPase subunit I